MKWNDANRKCKSCALWYTHKENEFLCSDCFRFKHPEKSFKNQKQKEIYIRDQFMVNFT